MARAISTIKLETELKPDADELAFLAEAAFAFSVRTDEAAAFMGPEAWYGLSVALMRISEHLRGFIEQPGGETEVAAD